MRQTRTAPEMLLRARDLAVAFDTDSGRLRALDGVSFAIGHGETVCLVGESGCGKTVTAKTILRVLSQNAVIESGMVDYRCADGARVDLASLPERDRRLRSIRGNEVAMIYQEPMSAMSAMYTVGNQIAEVLVRHRRCGKKEARRVAIAAMRDVGIPDPERRFDAYTFELSGGLRQRAMIAQALVCEPRLLIADEPTTALDVTTQAVILDLLRELQRRRAMSMLFITHDLGVVAQVADRVVILYLGQVAEHGPAERVLTDPQHPYTAGLLASVPSLTLTGGGRLPAIPGAVPSLDERAAGCPFASRCAQAIEGLCEVAAPPVAELGSGRYASCHLHAEQVAVERISAAPAAAVSPKRVDRATPPLLSVRGLVTDFPVRAGLLNRTVRTVRAVNEVSFDLWPGETMGLVGESGCGKTTLAHTLVGLTRATAGTVRYRNRELAAPAGWREHRSEIRLVFQDPVGSLNPRMTAFDIVAEVLRVAGHERTAIAARVREVFAQVGLDESSLRRYPHAFSGGQRQRIGIARVLAPGPRLIVADEPVSALDVSVQAQILNLLRDLQRSLGLTYLLISHDLGVVANLSDRVAVMYAGRIVEVAPAGELFAAPRHPYTEALLSAVLSPDPRSRGADHIRLAGAVPDLARLPNGCAFASRCRYAIDRCHRELPPLATSGRDRSAACHLADQLELRGSGGTHYPRRNAERHGCQTV